jgi:hypothetical protein
MKKKQMQNKSSNYHIQCEIAYLLTSEHQKLSYGLCGVILG